MTQVTVTTRGRKRRRTFKGITSAARSLQVTRQHLYLVLIGERESPRITRNLRVVEAGHAGV